jgi:hypothetical protein
MTSKISEILRRFKVIKQYHKIHGKIVATKPRKLRSIKWQVFKNEIKQISSSFGNNSFFRKKLLRVSILEVHDS